MPSFRVTIGLFIALIMSSYGFGQNNVPERSTSSGTDRFSLHVEIVHPASGNYAITALQITETNLTDELLILSTFRFRESDPRIVLEQGSTRLKQRDQLEDGSFPLGREGAGTVIKPHATTSELSILSGAGGKYELSAGSYRAYVIMRDPQTKRLIRSNTVSFEYSATQTTNAR
jgi:hypothetical protein